MAINMKKYLWCTVIVFVVAGCGKVPSTLPTGDLVPIQKLQCLDTTDTAKKCTKR